MPATGDTRRSWAIAIKAELERVAQAERDVDDTTPQMFLVPSYIKTLNPRAYDHRVLSFGLYNRDFENMTRMDEVRLEVVSFFLEQMKSCSTADSWDDLCEVVAGPSEKAQSLRAIYDDGPDEKVVDSATVRSVLVFDAVFLMNLLLFYSSEFDGKHAPGYNFQVFNGIFHQKGVNRNLDAVYLDLWMFENQVPLSLIRKVWNQVYADRSDQSFDSYISHTVRVAMETYLLPQAKLMFDKHHDHRLRFQECSHLLHCLYKAVCHHSPPPSVAQDSRRRRLNLGETISKFSLMSREILSRLSHLSSALSTFSRKVSTLLLWFHSTVRRMVPFSGAGQSSNFESRGLRSLPPITELLKAGIVVKGMRTNVTDIMFIKSTFYKATLSLPQIDIDDNTETILRNLGSFEMIHSADDHRLISYLSIMDDLINTEEDVRFLRKGKEPVIGVNFLGDDKDIAALFNALGQNVCFRKTKACISLTDEVNDWCTQENRQNFIRFIDRFRDRPWILGSLIAATLLLVMTALQTIFGIVAFYRG